MLINAIEHEIENLIDGDDPYLPVKCPFCGDIASSTEFSKGLWFIQCIKCHACGPTRLTPADAREAWNKRV